MSKTLSDYYIAFTTDASGDVTVIDTALTGMLHAIEWIDGDLADGTTAVISCTLTGTGVDQTLLTLSSPDANADKWFWPRAETHDLAGQTNGGMEYLILNGNIKIVVASGGNAKTGGINIWYWKP
jgi:hypothetical protein